MLHHDPQKPSASMLRVREKEEPHTDRIINIISSTTRSLEPPESLELYDTMLSGLWFGTIFSIYWEESSSQLSNIFQRGWNHQPVII